MRERSSRDYKSSRNSEYSTHRRHGKEKYAREAERSRRIEKRDRFDRDFNLRAGKSSVDDDRDIDRSGIRVRSSRSPRRVEIRGRLDRDDRVQTVRLPEHDVAGKDRDRDGRVIGQSRKFYDEDPHHMYSISPKFHRDFHVDGSRQSTRDNDKDYSYTSFHGAGDTDTTRGIGERDYSQSRYSDSYTFDNGRIGGVIQSNFERDECGSHISEMGVLNSDTEKLGYFHLQNQLLLEKRNRALLDRGKRYSENEEFDFHFQDGLDHDELGMKRPVERETSKYVEWNLLSSRDYVKSDSDFFSSLAQSESIYFNECSEKRQYVSPRRRGDQRNDTRSCSRSYLGLPEEKHVDHFYAGKSKIDRGVDEYRDQHTSRMSFLDPIVESSRGKRTSDDDGLWDPYSSSRGQSTPYHGYGSMRDHDFHADMNGGQISRHERSDVWQSREYEPPIDRLCDIPRKKDEPSERRLGDEHFTDEAFARHVSITKRNDAPTSSRKNYGQVSRANEVDLVSLPKKNKSSKYDYEKEGRMPSQRDNSHSSYPPKSDCGNIKRRLGPVPKKRNLLQRVVQKYKPHMKMRPAPPKR